MPLARVAADEQHGDARGGEPVELCFHRGPEARPGALGGLRLSAWILPSVVWILISRGGHYPFPPFFHWSRGSTRRNRGVPLSQQQPCRWHRSRKRAAPEVSRYPIPAPNGGLDVSTYPRGAGVPRPERHRSVLGVFHP